LIKDLLMISTNKTTVKGKDIEKMPQVTVKVPRGTKVVFVESAPAPKKKKPRMKVGRGLVCKAGVCKGMTKSEAMKFITEKHGECYLNGWLVRMKDEFGTSQPRVEQICHRPKHHRDVERVEQLCKRFRRVAPVVLLVIALLLRRCAW